MPILEYKGKRPKIHPEAMISPQALIVGDVEIGRGSSVFPGAVLRGDVARIRVGEYTNIQENAVLHGGDIYEGSKLVSHTPVEVGSYVTIAHGAVVHGCRVEDTVMIGVRAVVFNQAVIGEGSIVGMGAVVLEGMKVPPRSVVVGVPAKAVKRVDDVAYSMIRNHALFYHRLAKSHVGGFLTYAGS